MYIEEGRAAKRSDALLDHILKLRGERIAYMWALEYSAHLAKEMVTANEQDRNLLVLELLTILRTPTVRKPRANVRVTVADTSLLGAVNHD